MAFAACRIDQVEIVTTSGNSQQGVDMVGNKTFTGLLITVFLPLLVLAATNEALQTAASDGKVAFVLVTEPGTAGTDQARQIIQSAMAQVSGSIMIESNRADAANAEFVKKYGLAAAPLPLVLVFGSNGVMAGGNLASRLSTQQLVAMVPSPKKAEVVAALQSGKAVYVTAARPGMALKSKVASGCAAACRQMMGRGTAVEINMDNQEEQEFLRQLKIDTQSAEPVTVVINSKGQVTGSYTGAVEVNSLISSATKAVSSGCCPGGSTAGCGPTPSASGGK